MQVLRYRLDLDAVHTAQIPGIGSPLFGNAPGAALPADLLEQGRELAPYDDLGGVVTASASPSSS